MWTTGVRWNVWLEWIDQPGVEDEMAMAIGLIVKVLQGRFQSLLGRQYLPPSYHSSRRG